MSDTIPKSLFSNSRSSFALIDPATGNFHRRFDRHGYLTSGLRRHVAISYVWSEWKTNPADRLPDWTLLRERLLAVVGDNAPAGLRKETWGVNKCWIDCKCIDQDSDLDKAYWIPRMDEVYAEARCTVLLVRDDLSPLMHLSHEISCRFKGKLNSVDELLAPHNCLLSQSCTLLPDLAPERENVCLDALESFTSGAWQRRAWILQEVLLSENYLLSWGASGWMSLSDVGVIAGALSFRHPTKLWLREFANWCRRLWYLRQNYGETQSFELSDANVLQLAAGLEATVPCDKFYALCGLLRLKSIEYNAGHTADEALQNIVAELVRNGRLSWLYAIRPCFPPAGVTLRANDLMPFVLTRLDSRLMANRKEMTLSGGRLRFAGSPIGVIVRTSPLKDFLEQAAAAFDRHREFNFSVEEAHLAFAPAVIRRIAVDIIEPLLTDAVFDTICDGLSISREMSSRGLRVATMVMRLFTYRRNEGQSQLEEYNEADLRTRAMIEVAAWSIQTRLSEMTDFAIVGYSRDTAITGDDPANRSADGIALSTSAVELAAFIYSVDGDRQLQVIAGAPATSTSVMEADVLSFQGMMLGLNGNEVIGPQPSRLFSRGFWRGPGRDQKACQLTFACE
ncbi:uncharacterized protein GGS22DRAFT_59316 [Annulohypoxylon maeteangense]|uniref:uncharacterized protein n=1 Tax=Annulohypoxylon maeteangense TaxID=1927788 RepID=UPI0020079BFF|nr:uncharacterized protein GGS22DRAFT_59316 [Annulohypoxylon maeteangense]KAI0881529.1 hypothetical protein GGS22DRAFT_59316 [Annulohypoxylon maeteangense]